MIRIQISFLSLNFQLARHHIITSFPAIGMVVEIPEQALAKHWREELQRTARLFLFWPMRWQKRLPKIKLKLCQRSKL